MFEHDDIFVKLYQQFKRVAMLDLQVEFTCIRTFAAMILPPPAPSDSVSGELPMVPMHRWQFGPALPLRPASAELRRMERSTYPPEQRRRLKHAKAN
jgi:hypothetical protein